MTGEKQHLSRPIRIEITLARASKVLRPAAINIWTKETVSHIGHIKEKTFAATTDNILKHTQFDHNLASFKYGKTAAGVDVETTAIVRNLWSQDLSYRLEKPKIVEYRLSLTDESTTHKMRILESVNGMKFVGVKVSHYSWPLNATSNQQQFTKMLNDGSSIMGLISYIGAS